MKKYIISILCVWLLSVNARHELDKNKKLSEQASEIKSIYADVPRFDIEKAYNKENVVPIAIIGAGPAGLGAALYTGRANIHTVVFAGPLPGGQLTETSYIENWLGFKKILGYELMNQVQEHAQGFGAIIKDETITRIEFDTWPFVLHTSENNKVHALIIIIATGSSPRKLGVPNELTYWGRGVSSCAICDCVFFKQKNVYIVGGGDAAIEQAMQLASYAKNVNILVRKDRMRAAASMQNKLDDYPNVRVMYNKEVVKVLGDSVTLEGLEIKDTDTNELEQVQADGLFLAIGHNPNTELFQSGIKLDNYGYIILEGRSQATSVKGIFAAGDVADSIYRQAMIAAGCGAQAGLEAVALLRDIGLSDLVVTRLKRNYF